MIPHSKFIMAAAFAVACSAAGTFTYHCTIHPGMVGTVVVQ